jgi:hypothetical protein
VLSSSNSRSTLFRELIEIDTVTQTGDTLQAANAGQALVARAPAITLVWTAARGSSWRQGARHLIGRDVERIARRNADLLARTETAS